MVPFDFSLFWEFPLFWELFLFAILMTGTPGPNNVLTFVYALRFGLKTAVLFRLGICIGAPIMCGLMAWGALPFFATYPIVLDILTGVSILFILYIAYSIITSDPHIKSNQTDIVVMGVWGSTFFQFINGKVWSMALAVSSLYTIPTDPIAPQVFNIWLAFFTANIITAIPWVWGGLYFREFFQTPSRMRVFNLMMGISLMIMAAYSAVS